MQAKIRESQHPLDRILGRGRADAAEADRLVPAHCIGEVAVIVVGAGIAAHPRNRDRRQARTAREQIDRGGARLERHGGGVKRRRGAADHREALLAQRSEIDRVRGVRVQMPRQPLAQHRRDIGPAGSANAVGEDDFPRGLDRHPRSCLQMHPEMPLPGLDMHQPGTVAHRDIEKISVPGEVFGPGRARDAPQSGIGLPAMAGLIPGLEPEAGNPELRPGQGLRRTQHIHPRRVQPHSRRRLARRHVDDRDPADPGPAQAKREGAAGLAAPDDHDVVVDRPAIRRGALRDPALRIGADQAQRVAGPSVRIVPVGLVRHVGTRRRE